MRFSERMGFVRPREVIQIQSMDAPLRNRLWNLVRQCMLQVPRDYSSLFPEYVFVERVWDEVFREPQERLQSQPWDFITKTIRTAVFEDGAWYQVYDFLEFAAAAFPGQVVLPRNWKRQAADFTDACNQILEEEMAGYRFVGIQVAPIVTEEEINSIEQAMGGNELGEREHIQQALKRLSDRENPDYRNSIKESISAVEAVCRRMAGGEALTLGKALKALKATVPINPRLREGFDKLYAYTNDKNGIRHAIMDQEEVSFAEAKFMLVACSAFVNYLTALSSQSAAS